MRIRKPAPLLAEYWPLFEEAARLGPAVDLACGRGDNGLFLAAKGIPVILIDGSEDRLATARHFANKSGIRVDIRLLNLEQARVNPLEGITAGGMLVFRYLHRPLIPAIRQSIQAGGVLMYETFTREQSRLGKPRNPDFLLQPGELKLWFQDWNILHYFEGVKEDPRRAIAQIVCRKHVSPVA
jgi:tellurite methyltransferase